jgi:hypothetical protein
MEKKYDAQFRVVFDAIRELMTPPEPNKRKIGRRGHGSWLGSGFRIDLMA